MLILTLRTDNPEAEAGLYDGDKKLGYTSWQAHRALAETIHQKVKKLLDDHKKELKDIDGIVIFKGPGSFTGLRIGFSVANALADSLQVHITAVAGDGWTKNGIAQLLNGQGDKMVLPDYGAEPKTTRQKK